MARECYLPAVFTGEIAEDSRIIDHREHGVSEGELIAPPMPMHANAGPFGCARTQDDRFFRCDQWVR